MDEFGSFLPIFEGGELAVPAYLPLLNPGDTDDVRVAVDRIDRAFRADDPLPGVAAMLGQPNWRPDLVAAVAFLLDHDSVLDRTLLWQTIITGWVTPQFVATAGSPGVWGFRFCTKIPFSPRV